MEEPVRLSLVLPCYNGGRYIARSLRTLFGYLEAHAMTLGPSEVHLVDDGSGDDTTAAATATGLPFRLVRHKHNRGKGAAVQSGMREARGRVRIFMDADLPFGLDVIPRMCRLIETAGADVCIGSRTDRGTVYRIARPAQRSLASWMFAHFVVWRLVPGLGDTQCGIKGFRAAAADYLFRESRVAGFAFDVELLYLARKNAFVIETVPVEIVSDAPSTLRMGRDGLIMLGEVLRLPVRFHRGGYRMCEGRPSSVAP